MIEKESRKKTLKKNLQNPRVAFTEFSREYRKDTSKIFCFFEGDDSQYYGSRIRTCTRKESRYFRCGGKQGVLTAHEMISQRTEYDDAMVAYFIDRDFDPSIYSEENPEKYANIYETPCYAIENFYTSLNCFQAEMLNDRKKARKKTSNLIN